MGPPGMDKGMPMGKPGMPPPGMGPPGMGPPGFDKGGYPPQDKGGKW
jgi:hypothetical protein